MAKQLQNYNVTETTSIKPMEVAQQDELEFVRAKEVAIFSQDGEESEYNPLNKQWKGIADESNPNKVFNIVSNGYKIAQHEDVYNLISEAIKDHGLDAEVKVDKLNDGARIHGRVTFPELKFDLNGRTINMRMTFDNSYDATTGVRMIVGARCVKQGIVYYVRGTYSTFYHRHTKGLDINDITKKVEKGVKAFQEKIHQKFVEYSNEKIDKQKALDFLKSINNDAKKNNKANEIPDKYLSKIIKQAQNANTQWDLYEASCMVLSQDKDISVDNQRTLSVKMDSKIQANLSKIK